MNRYLHTLLVWIHVNSKLVCLLGIVLPCYTVNAKRTRSRDNIRIIYWNDPVDAKSAVVAAVMVLHLKLQVHE